MRRNVAQFKLSSTLLSKMMGMPENTLILKADVEPWDDSIRLYVDSPDLPQIPEGSVPPEITPTVTFQPDGTNVWDWNVKP